LAKTMVNDEAVVVIGPNDTHESPISIEVLSIVPFTWHLLNIMRSMRSPIGKVNSRGSSAVSAFDSIRRRMIKRIPKGLSHTHGGSCRFTTGPKRLQNSVPLDTVMRIYRSIILLKIIKNFHIIKSKNLFYFRMECEKLFCKTNIKIIIKT
jgi:hypothetical protein